MALNTLPMLEKPNWLQKIIDGEIPSEFPLEGILRDSLFYAGSGLNGTPIKFLTGNVFSFVYVDINIPRECFLRDLEWNPPLGHDLIYSREISTADLKVADNVSLPFKITPEESEKLSRLQSHAMPFGHWSIWRNRENGLAFSLLFLGGEFCAVFHALYVQNKIAPRYLAIIQPGRNDGIMGWDRFQDDSSHFHELVMNNPAGAPEFLVSGNSWDWPNNPQPPYWSEYDKNHLAFLPERCATVCRLKRK
jgi:hypothetical protein